MKLETNKIRDLCLGDDVFLGIKGSNMVVLDRKCMT